MRRGVAPSASMLLLAAACTWSGLVVPTPGPAREIVDVGASEGELRLIAPAGYVEDGSSDPDVDWLTEFEERSACEVSVRYADSAEEILSLMRREGEQAYDGVAAPGHVAGELIALGAVAAVDPALFHGFGDILEPLRTESSRHYVVDGNVYGVPALYGPNLLLYDTRRVDPAPTGWDVVFDPDSPYAGRIAMLDSPMAIADAAMYLASHEPTLGIEDPYALTPRQLDAATALLERVDGDVALYWRLFTEVVDAFREREVVVGSAWPIALSLLEIGRRPVEAALPVEGMTGWADTWMVSARARHPNCMIRWMRWTLRPQVQAQMALWYAAAPSNAKACRFLREALGDLADQADGLRFGRCGDERFLASLALWRRPTVECGDGRGRVCAGAPAWQLRWRSIRD